MSASLLILPFLEELGLATAITAGAEALGISEGIATFAGVSTEVATAKKLAAPLDAKALEYYKAHIEGTGSDYFNMASSVFNQDPSYFLKKERFRQHNEKLQKQNQTKVLNTPIQPRVIIPDIRTGTTDDSFKVIQGFQRFTDQITNITRINNTDINSNVPITNSTLTPNLNTFIQSSGSNNDPYDLFQSSPRDLARYVIDISRRLAETKNLKEATLDTLALEPEAYSLAQKVSRFMAGKALPNTDEFKKIKKIFNGRNINENSFSIARNPTTKLIEVSGINELGQKMTLPETTGLTLPSVPGTVFMGPKSKNNKVPTKGRVEDYFSFFHDYSWRNGNFNKTGDMQFISRLHTALEDGRVLPENVKLVSATIIYFANISLSLSMFVDQPQEDIFSVLGGVEANDPAYLPLRDEFYQVLSQELTSYTNSDGFFVKYKDNYVNDLINNISFQ
jgi:hypothetical protein